jgi:hypothetical protein
MERIETNGEKAFGRFGWFATTAELTDRRVVEAVTLKAWLGAHPTKAPSESTLTRVGRLSWARD